MGCLRPDHGSQSSHGPLESSPRRPFIDYETFVWAVFLVFTLLAVIDRFTLNVWPRELYSIGAGVAATDFKDGLLPGPWTVKVYDITARVSGRYSIVALNLLLFTTMRCTTHWLSESWFGRHIFDFSNIFDANMRLHKWNGIVLAVMTLVHVWTILLPPVFSGWRAQVLRGTFEYILSERKPPGFKDINAVTETVSLQVDDVFRLVEMSLLLAILLPLSIKWMSTRWHVGIHVHRTIAVIYFIDIVRRHTHPHSWILNTPFFILWVLDHLVSVFWRRNRPDIYRVTLSDNYMLLFWNQKIRSNTVGPKYYLRLTDSSMIEPAHTFTAFENRRDLQLADGRPWSTCLLVRTYYNKRTPRLTRRDKYSHTQRVAEAMWGLDMKTWGPFHGNMCENARVHLEGSGAVTLVGGGSAAGYILDALQMYGTNRKGPLTVLYTCRDAALFDWIAGVVTKLMYGGACEDSRVVLAVTDRGVEDGTIAELVRERQVAIEEGRGSFTSSGECDGGSLSVQHGRIDFVKELGEGNTVFFQGSGGLQRSVAEACRKKRSRFVAGPVFDQEGNAGRKRLLKEIVRRCTACVEARV